VPPMYAFLFPGSPAVSLSMVDFMKPFLKFPCFCWLLLAVALGGIVFSQDLASPFCPGWLRGLASLVLGECDSSGSQWFIVVSLAFYLGLFLTLGWPPANNSELRNLPASGFLIAFLSLAVGLYLLRYDTGSLSTEVPTLLAGILAGKWVSFWTHANAAELRMRSAWVAGMLVFLFALASLCETGGDDRFLYHGVIRWNGAWDNPNTSGLLMGAGFVLTLCPSRSFFKPVFASVDPAGVPWLSGAWRPFILSVRLVSAGLLLLGLAHSFSRGAWLGTLAGVGWLLWPDGSRGSGVGRGAWELPVRRSAVEFQRRWKSSWITREWRLLSAILLALVVLGFWQFRETGWHPARRVFSLSRTEDFSWRNRVAAWEGALQIMAEHAWLGAGWNEPVRLYNSYYLPPKLTEGEAMEMNDLLILGASLGLPALFGFALCVWSTLNRQQTIGTLGNQETRIPISDWLPTTCHAAAIVLLVGFWFDGGLFKLPAAATFWILLELGTVRPQNYLTATNSKIPENCAS